MKILITTDWYQPVINGVVTSTIGLAQGLESMGHDVRILTLSGSLRSYQEDNVTYIGSVSVGLLYPNARLKMALTHRYIQELIDWKPDIVHSQCEFSTFFLAKKIAQTCHAPLVHTYHTVYEDFTHYFSPNVRLGRMMAAAFSRRILAKTQAVIAPTGKVSAMLARYGVRQPIYTVPSGLNLDRLMQVESDTERSRLRGKLGIADQDSLFVYLGRLAREKNIEELFALLKEQAPPRTRLLLVGDGPHRESLERLADEMNLSQRVIFAGMVQPDQVWKYYKIGDVFVSASQSETQGLTYIEAMASGLPVLCRKDPCLDAVIRQGDNGFMYTSAEQFGSISKSLFSSPDYRRTIGQAAQESARNHFSVSGFAEAVNDVYCACLSQKATLNPLMQCNMPNVT